MLYFYKSYSSQKDAKELLFIIIIILNYLRHKL